MDFEESPFDNNADPLNEKIIDAIYRGFLAMMAVDQILSAIIPRFGIIFVNF